MRRPFHDDIPPAVAGAVALAAAAVVAAAVAWAHYHPRQPRGGHSGAHGGPTHVRFRNGR